MANHTIYIRKEDEPTWKKIADKPLFLAYCLELYRKAKIKEIITPFESVKGQTQTK